MMLALYTILTDAAALPMAAALRWRSAKGKEDRKRLSERRGVASKARPEGRIVWCHAASVGESIALLPVIEHFCAAEQSESAETNVVMTTGTVTSAAVMAERLPAGAVHQYAPWDRRTWVRRFLEYWQPDLAIRMESELWPNTLSELHDRNIPVAVINGRLSAETVRGWGRVPGMARDVFGTLDLVIAQSETFAAAFQQLGAPRIEVAPNIKLAAEPLPVDDSALTSLRAQIGERPVWLAASTHSGEEDMAARVHTAIAQDVADVLTIIAPRHPERGRDIVEDLRRANLTTAQRSRGETITPDTDVYVADTLGELGLLFSVAPVVFMGKSMSTAGGQNPIEPVHFGCAILFGPHMENFQDIAETMSLNEMVVPVSDENGLIKAVRELLTDDVKRSVLSARAKSLPDTGAQGLATTIDALSRLLEDGSRHGR